jgi:hypothetical protein
MQTPNRDLFPTAAMLERFPTITPLLVNEPIDNAFKRHEVISVAAKKLYHRLGLLSIILVGGSAIYTVADTLLMKGAAGPLVSLAAAIAGSIGLGSQIYMLAAKLKSKWLVNRFACERIRSLKFQSYSIAATAADEEELARRIKPYCAAELAKLESELNMGISTFETFVPDKAVIVPKRGPGPINETMVQEAIDAFRELRVQYQDRFAAGELHRLKEHKRAFHSAADTLYFVGACLVLLSLLSKIVPAAIPISAWVDFLAISAFILSISKDVLDNAALTAPSAARFQRYREDIAEVEAQIAAGAELDSFVPQMERVALGELEEFCDASKSINYRL